MTRREFITLLGGAAVAWPIAAGAQQGERMRRIGALTPGLADQDWLGRNAAFLQALALLGWIDSRNVRIEYRWGEGNAENIRKHLTELVALAPDVILVSGSAAVGPLLQGTRTIPIVVVAGPGPVGGGLVDC